MVCHTLKDLLIFDMFLKWCTCETTTILNRKIAYRAYRSSSKVDWNDTPRRRHFGSYRIAYLLATEYQSLFPE